MDDLKTLPYREWLREGYRLCGSDRSAWRYACPACGHVSTPDQWRAAGAPEGAIAYACVGRWCGVKRAACGTGEGPCDYAVPGDQAGVGWFSLKPVAVTTPEGVRTVFAFAPPPPPWPANIPTLSVAFDDAWH